MSDDEQPIDVENRNGGKEENEPTPVEPVPAAGEPEQAPAADEPEQAPVANEPEQAAPVADEPEPVVEESTPAVEEPTPAVEEPESVAEPEQIADVPEPESEPVADVPEPVEDLPEPEPVEDLPAPVEDFPEPVEDLPEPVEDVPEPEPEPVADEPESVEIKDDVAETQNGSVVNGGDEHVEEFVPATQVMANGDTKDDDYLKIMQEGNAQRYSDMSTKAQAQDLDQLKEVLASVRADTGDIHRKSWAIIGHTDNHPNMIGVVDSDVSDAASFPDMLSRLKDDQVMYCLLRLTTTVDVSATVKFIYVHWIGESVPFAKRGRFGIVHGSIVELFHPNHVTIETGSRDDLQEEQLIAKLEESSGTKSHVIDWAEANKRQERGFTQHQVQHSNLRIAKVSAPEGATIQMDEDLKNAIAEVRQDSSEIMWLIGGFPGGNLKAPLSLVAKGSGGVDNIKESLVNDQPMCVLYRTCDVIDGYKTVKFVYIFWMGEDTKPILKGKVMASTGAIERLFGPIHVSLSFTNRYDMAEDAIMDKVMAGSGTKLNVK